MTAEELIDWKMLSSNFLVWCTFTSHVKCGGWGARMILEEIYIETDPTD